MLRHDKFRLCFDLDATRSNVRYGIAFSRACEDGGGEGLVCVFPPPSHQTSDVRGPQTAGHCKQLFFVFLKFKHGDFAQTKKRDQKTCLDRLVSPVSYLLKLELDRLLVS